MVSPQEKISGVYNFNFSLLYLDAQGNKYRPTPAPPSASMISAATPFASC